jgi:hypothetical protein
MKIFFIFILTFYSIESFSQTDTMFMFNNLIQQDHVVKKSDLCHTDTLKTNIDGLTVAGYTCTTTCAVDFEIRENSNIISDKLRSLLCGCLKSNNQKVYFENIIFIDENGNQYQKRSYVIRLKLE